MYSKLFNSLGTRRNVVCSKNAADEQLMAAPLHRATDAHTDQPAEWVIRRDQTGVGSAEETVELVGIAPWRQHFSHLVVQGADRAGQWLVRHWLLVMNVALGLFVGIAVLVPILFALGADSIATPIFHLYHLVCDQLPSHSYFIFGYQLALCSRNLAIFGSLFVGTLAFHAVRGWWPQLHWSLWLLTVLPMALDGGTQLFGWRESTWELRTLTGVIFGLGICWLLLPALEDAAAPADAGTTSTRRRVLRLVRHHHQERSAHPTEALAHP
jgi:uncharacterized membrane protein